MLFSLGYLSPADYDQLLARTLRPGQDNPVTYLHLVAEDTIEEQIYSALRQRKDVIQHLTEQLVA